jgi:hypothetical protein
MMGEFIKIYKTLNGYYVFDVNTKTIIKILNINDQNSKLVKFIGGSVK